MKTLLLLLLILVQLESETITLGKSNIKIYDKSFIGTQIDRVFRDLAWENSIYEYGKVDLFDTIVSEDLLIPYMEGYATQLLIRYANVTVKGLTPCIAYKRDDKYYSMNSKREFIYYIDDSKTLYKTGYTSINHGIFEDTHGFNMIANIAIEINRTRNIDLVIACMDVPSKADAALELADNGINCYAPCDRFAYTLLGYNSKGTIIGTAPIRNTQYGAIIGDQAISFNTEDKIIVQTTDKGYPDQYCDTPYRYFTALKDKYNLPLNLFVVDAGVGETYKIIEKAKEEGAKVIGVRLNNDQDVIPVREWLLSNKEYKAILFHTSAYKIEFFDEFPQQTTFGDLKPLIE